MKRFCLKIINDFPREAQQSKLHSYLTENKHPLLLAKIINSLGTVDEKAFLSKVTGLNDLLIESVDLKLNNSGRSFLTEIITISEKTPKTLKFSLDIDVMEDAKLIFLDGQPAGIFYTNKRYQRVYYFEFTNFFQDEKNYKFKHEIEKIANLAFAYFIDDSEKDFVSRSTTTLSEDFLNTERNEPLAVLEINLPGFFYSSHISSLEFQQEVIKYQEYLKDKRVIEIGSGTAVNGLLALSLGAKSYAGNDSSYIYYLLSKWMIEYNKERQVNAEPLFDRMKIKYGSGFVFAETAEMYIFNTPAVYNNATYNRLNSIQMFESYYFNNEEFTSIFGELKERLNKDKNRLALWRIMNTDYSLLKEKTELDAGSAFLIDQQMSILGKNKERESTIYLFKSR